MDPLDDDQTRGSGASHERPTHEPIEGEYLAPSDDPASGRSWRAAGGTAIGIGLFFAKFKGLLIALLNIKWLLFASKYALTGLSFLVSIVFYAQLFGWKFGIMLVLLLAIHEVGHYIFVRGYGFAAPAIYFVPGLGALTSYRPGDRQSIFQQAVIAFGGPLLGTIGGLVCFGYGAATGEPFWYAVAYTAFFMNLVNMIPVGIFDGGRIVGAITPRLWIVGFVCVIVAALAFRWFSPILLLIVLLSVPRVIAVVRGTLDPRYAAVTGRERITISLAYFGLLALLLACLVFARIVVPGQPAA